MNQKTEELIEKIKNVEKTFDYAWKDEYSTWPQIANLTATERDKLRDFISKVVIDFNKYRIEDFEYLIDAIREDTIDEIINSIKLI